MALITKIEAAIKLGVGMDLLEHFCEKCPKPKQDRKLATVSTAQGDMIDEKELENFQRYLHSAWPKPPKGNRPYLPEAMKEDIRQESHYGCAICGHMDNGEIAHIEPVAETLNNGPDNLIYLCPNHHTKYDYGAKPTSNITIDEVHAAKALKRRSRQRMLQYEGNVTRALKSLLRMISDIQKKLKLGPDATLISIYETEAKALLPLVNDLTDAANAAAQQDREEDVSQELLAMKSPLLTKAVAGIRKESTARDVREAVSHVAGISDGILIDLDQEDCPRCGGRGMTGLVGDLCAYCRGSCVVSRQEAEEYDPEDIDEAECPHCHGNGTLGYDQHWCPYCHGSCLVSRDEAEDYDESEIDEVDCPYCNGRGILGYDQHFCPYCKGACRITKAEAEEFDENEIDEVDCPHCNAHGTIGHDQHYCPFCKGACRIPAEDAAEYDPEEIDEVDCPHCNGRGILGRDQHFCPYCRGACRITQQEVDDYDPDEIDEVECPHCLGRGETGLVGDDCKLCKGECVVSHDIRQAYYEQYPQRRW